MRKVQISIGIVLIIIGIIIVFPVLSKKIETYKMQKELQNKFEENINLNLSEKSEVDNKVDNSRLESNLETEEHKDEDEFEEVNGYNPVALMEIPSINLSQIIVDGTEDDILQYFLGRMSLDVQPGDKGNFIVAGHRVSDYTDAFINLYKVQKGDKVYIRTKEKETTYEVTEVFIVDPHQVEVLDQTENATMTLITCTVGAKQRLIVKGKLINYKNLN